MGKIKNSKAELWILVVGFALLMTIPFLVPGAGAVALIAFVPLLYLDKMLRERAIKHAFWYYFLAFLLFNIGATFWIWFVSPVGSIAALSLNALQMAAIFALFRWAGKVLRKGTDNFVIAELESFAFLIVAWLAWEHVYFIVELSWPWLCLGNAFATSPQMVQWYEIFGSLGGSFWILVCNVLIFMALTSTEKRRLRRFGWAAAALVLIPIICSEIRYATYKEHEDPLEVVVVQPNVDPFAKYGNIPQQQLDDRLLALIDSLITPETKYIVTPETFTYNIDIDQPQSNHSYDAYSFYLARHPETTMLLGALTFRTYSSSMKPSRSARPKASRLWIDVFNTAMTFDAMNMYSYYFKSKLVPGVEIIPYENVLKFLGPLVAKFGGSSTSYGTMTEMNALEGADGHKVGAMICYESIYGDYSRKAVSDGADFMAVMTNDGWWGDTPGYRQHFRYARLRAIEYRRDIVHAANTGISGIINQRGDVLVKTPWWVETSFRSQINCNDTITPFVEHGDVIGRIAGWMLLVYLAAVIVFCAAGKRSSHGRPDGGKS